MPSSVKDRLTCTYETIFHFVKNRKYYYDIDAIREPHSTGTIKRIMQPNAPNQGKEITKQNLMPNMRGPLDAHDRTLHEMMLSVRKQYVKHDLAVNRIGNFSYNDPLHEKEYHPKGKNPGDVIKVKWSNVSGQSTQGNFGHGGTHGNRFNHPPGDIEILPLIKKEDLPAGFLETLIPSLSGLLASCC